MEPRNSPGIGMLESMMPLILGMIDRDAIDGTANMIAAELRKDGTELITLWDADDNGVDFTPEEFISTILGTLFDQMKGATDATPEETV